MMCDHGNIAWLGEANSVLWFNDWRSQAFFFFVVGFGLSELTYV